MLTGSRCGRRRRALRLAVCACPLVLAVPAWAAITVGGDAGEVLPTNPASWSSQTLGYIGAHSAKTGTLSISGATLPSYGGVIASSLGSTGIVTVTGPGAAWINSGISTPYGSGTLYVGEGGNGTLNIVGGGQVSSKGSTIGDTSGSTGTATVAGAGSAWTDSSFITVGKWGNGTLTIASGGQVSSSSGAISGDGTGWGGTFGGSSNSASVGLATVTGVGSTWTNSGTLSIGNSYYGTGQLNIENGGHVNSGSSSIATTWLLMGTTLYASTGTVTVTGIGSTWANSGLLAVGAAGNGTLNVANGGQVTSSGGKIGYDSKSTGIVTVTGTGSTWTNGGELYVGGSGNGTLSVSEGGVVNTYGLQTSSMGNLIGNGTINTKGLVSDIDLVFDATHGSKQTFSFGTGGALKLNVDGTGQLGAGYKGQGTLRIADGVAIASSGGTMGNNAGSTGTATVTGTGSTWTNSGALTIGNFGTGSLNIAGGGQVSSSTGTIGNNSKSTNAVTVTGAGAIWTNSGSLTIGNSGAGALGIGSGGQVLSSTGTIGNNAGSTGTATVTGTGSTWTNSGSLTIGNSGTGSLVIDSGGQVSSATGYIGNNAGSTGTATVMGTGSTWTNNGELYVAPLGSGTLTVSDGAVVNTYGLQTSSLGNLKGNGTINTKGLVSDFDLVFDATHSPQQPLSFGTGGALNLNMDGTGQLGVGYKGQGTLRIADGVAVAGRTGTLGSNAGSTGTATVTGVGSAWTNSASLTVGNSGSGSLGIDSGGHVSSSTGIIANNSGSTGTVTVAGPGSTWTNSGSLTVGKSGTGSVAIESGGLVTSNGGLIGDGFLNTNASGTVTVTGAGSAWTSSGPISVSGSANGTLTINSGAQVSSNGGVVGDGFFNHSASGAVTVSGAGSTWTNSGSITVSGSANGTLTINSGAQVSSNGGMVGDGFFNHSASGAVTVAGAGSTWTNSGALTLGKNSAGTLNINSGGQVSGSIATLGGSSSGIGTATVTGPGSTWANTGLLAIGDSGTGSLGIDSGGQVTSTSGYIGHNAGSTGTVAVTGTGSTWNNSGELYVAPSGNGTLTVSEGGTVNTYGLQISSLANLKGNGSVNTRGLVADLDLIFDVTHGSQQALSFGTGGVLNLNLDGSGQLGVGYKGQGTLRIADGVTANSSGGIIGINAGSTGTATVTGAGSVWKNTGALTVGQSGNGSLNVTGGGQINSSSASIGSNSGSTGAVTITGAGTLWTNSGELSVASVGTGTLSVSDGGTVNTYGLQTSSIGNLRGDGTINTKGLVSDLDLVFDATHGSQQAFSFGTGGVMNLNLDGTGQLGVGYKGQSTLRIADGVIVKTSGGTLGINAGSVGTATVTGPGSTWISSGALNVGRSGIGTLKISRGGQVSSNFGTIGNSSQSPSNVTVTGSGSAWMNGGTLLINAGSLNIDSGGQVSNTDATIGRANSPSTATVTGTGSIWNSNMLTVSQWGSLTIANGARVNSKLGFIAMFGFPGLSATGTVTATGMGSTWINGGPLYVGGPSGSTIGVLNIANGAQVKADTLSINNSSSSLNLRISGDNMLVLGSAAMPGWISSSGSINLYADSSLASGTYRPISDFSGRTMWWSGSGTYNAFGGLWDNTAKTFSVGAATLVAAGVADTLTNGERLTIDGGGNNHVGASFGAVPVGSTFAASLMTPGELSSLALDAGEGVLSAWDFTTDLTGSTVLLSFDVGADASNLQAWHYSGGAWTLLATDVTYSNGIASFTVNSFSGYAVTSAVPEPMGLTLLALAGMGLLRRRERRTATVGGDSPYDQPPSRPRGGQTA